MDLSWLENSALFAPEPGVSLKQWITIHGHPVNIGGGSGGGSGGGKGGKGTGAGAQPVKDDHADRGTLTTDRDRAAFEDASRRTDAREKPDYEGQGTLSNARDRAAFDAASRRTDSRSGGFGGGSGGAGNAFHAQVTAAHTAHHTYDPAHPNPASKIVHINSKASGTVDQAGADKALKAGIFNQGHMSWGKAHVADGKLHVKLDTAGTNSEGIAHHLNTFHEQTGLDPSIAKSHLKGGDLRLEFPIGGQASSHSREDTPAKPKVAGGNSNAELRPRKSDMQPLKPEPALKKPVKHRKPAGSF